MRVDQWEALNPGSEEHDPRPKLRKLEQLLGQLKNEQSFTTIKNLLKE